MIWPNLSQIRSWSAEKLLEEGGGGRGRVRRGGKLDYGSTSALTHWPYLLNALQKQLWLVHREWCSVQARMYMCTRGCVCVCVYAGVCVSWAYFMPAIQGLRNKSPYYSEEHAQCHLVQVHIPASPAPCKPGSHSQVIQRPFLPLWLGINPITRINVSQVGFCKTTDKLKPDLSIMLQLSILWGWIFFFLFGHRTVLP